MVDPVRLLQERETGCRREVHKLLSYFKGILAPTVDIYRLDRENVVQKRGNGVER